MRTVQVTRFGGPAVLEPADADRYAPDDHGDGAQAPPLLEHSPEGPDAP